MTFTLQSLSLRAAYTVVFGAVLAACGGSGSPVLESGAGFSASATQASLGTTAYVPQSRGTTAAVGSPNSSAPTGTITDIRIESTAKTAQTNIPVTFGQMFSQGHLSAGTTLVGRLDSGVTIPLQVDVKTKYPDGSARHAVISGVIPSLAANEVRTISLNRSSSVKESAASTASMLNAGFTAAFSATIDGVRYSASADELIKSGKASVWLNGNDVSEWQVSAPLTSSNGAAHPHLTARFAIRWYQAAKKARVDVAVENNWAYEAAPRKFTYDANLTVGGATAYSKSALTHFHHARWRKVAWWGTSTPEVNIKHNTAYLIETRAVPNYDQSLSIAESILNGYQSETTAAATQPMSSGGVSGYMPMTGGRRDIGILPGWTASYLLSMDKRARDITLINGDLGGSWSTHYRDKKTGNPVSLVDYPAMSTISRPSDTWNPATQRHEAFPDCAGANLCDSPYTPDTPHQPNLAYVPYLVTGDFYYLEELQFWAMWSAMASHPAYRSYEKALVISDQLRGQAWTLRTLAEAAYITPDSHPLKSHFAKFVDENLNWFNQTYTNGGANTNSLGIITNGYSLGYENGTATGPWQDDFFTASVGHMLELGFTKAEPLLRFKTKFVVDRMISAKSCWIFAAPYVLKVRNSENAPIYKTYDEAYANTNGNYLGMECNGSAMLKLGSLKLGEMANLSESVEGYPSNMQPALAYAANINGSAGQQAWTQFEQRTVKPNYNKGPQFAIKPR